MKLSVLSLGLLAILSPLTAAWTKEGTLPELRYPHHIISLLSCVIGMLQIANQPHPPQIERSSVSAMS